MSITFNAFEIFEMAEQIERNGAKFYRTAAKAFKDSGIAQTLLELADMEDAHEKVFADMRKQLSEKRRGFMAFDPENQMALYLQAMAGGRVFDMKKDPAKQLAGVDNVADILKMAIDAEKDSIVFYIGLKNFVPPKAGKDRVEAIINEEMGHLILLTLKLTVLA